MKYTLLFDVRFAGSFSKATRMLQDIFATAHRLSSSSIFAIDFPTFKGNDPKMAHMTALGQQIRLFGDESYLLDVKKAIDEQYGNGLYYPEGNPLSLRIFPIKGYAKVSAKRPRKSAAQAAARLKKHLEKKDIVLTHEITEGSPDYVYPLRPYITYESLSTKKRFSFYLNRQLKKEHGDKPESTFESGGTLFDRFGISKGTWVPVVGDLDV